MTRAGKRASFAIGHSNPDPQDALRRLRRLREWAADGFPGAELADLIELRDQAVPAWWINTINVAVSKAINKVANSR